MTTSGLNSGDCLEEGRLPELFVMLYTVVCRDSVHECQQFSVFTAALELSLCAFCAFCVLVILFR